MKIIEKMLKQKFDKHNDSVATTAVTKIIKKILKRAFFKIAIYAIITALAVIIIVTGLVMLTIWLIGGRAGQPIMPQVEDIVPNLINADTLINSEIGAGLEGLGQELIYIGDAIDQARP